MDDPEITATQVVIDAYVDVRVADAELEQHKSECGRCQSIESHAHGICKMPLECRKRRVIEFALSAARERWEKLHTDK